MNLAAVDYEVRDTVTVGSRTELIEALLAHQGQRLRVIGRGSAQHRLPAPGLAPALAPAPTHAVTLLSCARMDKIVRLEPEDLTCSVEPGLLRDDLDQTLAAEGLHLPCAGRGTLGGMFASGEHLPLAPGAPSPRSLLLGFEGVLAEGLPFKAGARVVKSVAGFDLHKLFVGSRGRLCIATLLHLKLRRSGRERAWFVSGLLAQHDALALYDRLRRSAPPPLCVILSRSADSFTVHGQLEGSTRWIDTVLHAHGLGRAVAPPPSFELGSEPNGAAAAAAAAELLTGIVRPSRIDKLLRLLPATASLLVTGTGQFTTRLDPAGSDALLLALPELEASAEIRVARRERRGLCTPLDPGVIGLQRRIKQGFDPAGMLQ